MKFAFYLKKSLRYFSFLLLFLFVLLFLLFWSFRLPVVQQKLAAEGSKFASNFFDTEVHLSKIYPAFPPALVIENLSIKDQEQKTLLALDLLSAKVAFWPLLDNHIEVRHFDLEGLRANVYRTDTADYNYAFLLAPFSDTTAVEEDTTSGTLPTFELNNFRFSNLHVHYDDQPALFEALLAINHLTFTLDFMNLDEMFYEVNDFKVDGLKGFMHDRDATTLAEATVEADTISETDTSGFPFHLNIGHFELKNIDFDYKSRPGNMRYLAKLPDFSVEDFSFSLDSQYVKLAKTHASHANVQVLLGISEKEATAQTEDTSSTASQEAFRFMDWEIEVGEMDYQNFQVSYRSGTDTAARPYFNPNALTMKTMDLKAADFYTDGRLLNVNLQNCRFKEASGFELKQLAAFVTLGERKAGLEDFIIETEHTKIQKTLSIFYPDLDLAFENLGDNEVLFDFDGSILGLGDLRYFSPDLALSPTYKDWKKEHFNLSGRMTGKLDDLLFKDLQANFGRNSLMMMNLGVKQVTKPEEMAFDLKIRQARFFAQDLLGIIPPNTMPDNIKLPPMMTLNANASGMLKDMKANMDLSTTFGRIEAKTTFKESRQQQVKLALNGDKVQLGKILSNDQIKALDFRSETTVDLVGFDWKNVKTQWNVPAIELMDYNYRNLSLKANASPQKATAEWAVQDSNLQMAFTIEADQWQKEDLQTTIEGSFAHVDFQKLNWTSQPIKIGDLSLKFKSRGSDFESFDASLKATPKHLVYEEDTYNLETFDFSVKNTNSQHVLKVESPFFNVDFLSNTPPLEMADLLARHFDRYFDLHDTTTNSYFSKAFYRVELDFKYHPLYASFLPELDTFANLNFQHNFTAANRDLNFYLHWPEVNYGEQKMKDFLMTASSDRKALYYQAALDTFMTGDLSLTNLGFQGSVEDNRLNFALSLLDRSRIEYFRFGFNFQSVDSGYMFQLPTDELVLLYESWEVAPDNYIFFNDTSLIVSGVTAKSAGQEVSISSKTDHRGDKLPVKVKLDNIDLYPFAKVLEKEEADTVFSGRLFLDAKLAKQNDGAIFYDADMRLENLCVFQNKIGNFKLETHSEKVNEYKLNLAYTADGYKLWLKGMWDGNREEPMDFRLHSKKVELEQFQPFVADYLNTLKGDVSLDVKIKGKPEDPKIDGFLHFEEVAFNSIYQNVTYLMPDEKLKFGDRKLSFDKFTLKDTENNTAQMSGYVDFNDLDRIGLNVDAQLKEFLLMDLKRSDADELYYFGKAIADANIRIRGSHVKPNIRTTASLKKGSDINVRNPEYNPGAIDKEGVVTFVNYEEEQRKSAEETDTTERRKSQLSGFDITAEINIDKATSFKVLIDEVAGDRLTAKGGGDLSFVMDPSGMMNLSGKYEINEGSYLLTFSEVVKRRFEIRSGSSITWQGDPYDALLDIKTNYRVTTNPAPLIGSNERMRPTPFWVVLAISGNLMQPEIAFELDMPPQERNLAGGQVYSRIQQVNQDEAERNKQAFGLLVLNSFLTEQGGDGGAPSPIASTARTSGSRILSQQLNRLSDKLVRGVEINFELESYEAGEAGTGGQTDMQVDVSKQFLDNRLSLSLGSNIPIEGENRPEHLQSDFAGDVVVEYALTEDGRYKIKAFRKNEFQSVIDGALIETGASVIFTRDFNEFRELMKRKEKVEEKRQKKESKKQQKQTDDNEGNEQTTPEEKLREEEEGLEEE